MTNEPNEGKGAEDRDDVDKAALGQDVEAPATPSAEKEPEAAGGGEEAKPEPAAEQAAGEAADAGAAPA